MLSDLKDLVKSRGWARLSSIAEAQKQTRNATVLKPGGGDDKEFMKGEIAGIALFMRLPEIAIENLQQQLEREDASDGTNEVPPAQ